MADNKDDNNKTKENGYTQNGGYRKARTITLNVFKDVYPKEYDELFNKVHALVKANINLKTEEVRAELSIPRRVKAKKVAPKKEPKG